MRISRKKRPAKPIIPLYPVNEHIRIPEVRLIGRDDEHLGVMPTPAALTMAQEQELDLVLINPKGEPPVAKLTEFAHFKYQKEKEVRKQRLQSHVSETKGIRLSIRISDHDLGVRRDQAMNFLERGDKVRIELIMRGRENARIDLGFAVVDKLLASLNESIPVRYEQEPDRQGNRVIAIIAKK